MKMTRLIFFAFAACLAPAAAFAHPGHFDAAATNGFLSGLAHPLSGLDHMLAMVAVGFWAASLGGAARWIAPAAFVAAMGLGAGLGLLVAPPMADLDLAIAASVAALGCLIAFDLRAPAPAAAALVALFAVAHGLAHGAEAPLAVSGELSLGLFGAFAAGFALSTAALHGVGLALGALRFGSTAQRLAGVGLVSTACWLAFTG